MKRQHKIQCDMLLGRPCPTPATVFFKAISTDRRNNEMQERYVARCINHESIPRAHKLKEIPLEEFVVAQVMES